MPNNETCPTCGRPHDTEGRLNDLERKIGQAVNTAIAIPLIAVWAGGWWLLNKIGGGRGGPRD